MSGIQQITLFPDEIPEHTFLSTTQKKQYERKSNYPTQLPKQVYSTCQMCSGLGAYNPFGPCVAGQFLTVGPCPSCNGKGEQLLFTQCRPCQAKGGYGPYGPCEIWNVHRNKVCETCKGIGYQ